MNKHWKLKTAGLKVITSVINSLYGVMYPAPEGEEEPDTTGLPLELVSLHFSVDGPTLIMPMDVKGCHLHYERMPIEVEYRGRCYPLPGIKLVVLAHRDLD